MSALEASEGLSRERRFVVAAVIAVASLLGLQVLAGIVREAVADEPSVLELVQTCLVERSTAFEPSSDDPIAASAGRGALRVLLDGNAVTVALGRSERDAERLYEAYSSVASADVVATRLSRDRNVVFLWDAEPTGEQREFMALCTLDAHR